MDIHKRIMHLKQYIMNNPGIILLILVCSIFFIDGINSIEHQIIGYDEGYNATVAANLARYGEYRVSYPDNIVFYNLITTGVPVILPTAVVYKIFGINYVTSAIIPLLYMTISIAFIWILFNKCLNKGKKSSLLAILLVIIIIVSDINVPYISTHLAGESACIFFLTAACLLFERRYSTKKSMPLLWAGMLVSAGFLTKSSMIFIFVSLAGIVLLERLIGNLHNKDVIAYFSGLIVGFVAIDSYKLIHLGGFKNWIDWWHAEWGNMMNQSGQLIEKPSVRYKFSYLKEIFGINKYAAACIILLPIILYLLIIVSKMLKKKTSVSAANYCCILFCVAASSLEVFFVLFGGSGLIYPRRHAVNEMIVKYLIVIIIGYAIIWLALFFKKKNVNPLYSGALICSMLILLFSYLNIAERAKGYVEKKSQADYDQKLMEEFLVELSELDQNAVLLCLSWWQEPNVSLFLDRKMTDIYSVDLASLDYDNTYFIVGRRFDNCYIEGVEQSFDLRLEKIDHIAVDYDPKYGFDSEDLFSIYQVRAR